MKLFTNYNRKVMPKPVQFKEPMEGIVAQAIAPNKPGRIKCKSSYWPAKFYNNDCKDRLEENQQVSVIGREGITLLVTFCPA